eukprot:14018921-Alexandrium_andersonii.AAC.1
MQLVQLTRGGNMFNTGSNALNLPAAGPRPRCSRNNLPCALRVFRKSLQLWASGRPQTSFSLVQGNTGRQHVKCLTVAIFLQA